MNEMADFLNKLPKKQPKKKAVIVLSVERYDLKGLYYNAREYYYKNERPVIFEAGHYFESNYPKITTTNGVQKYIKNVLNWLGHQAEKVNTMGVPMVDKYGNPILGKNGKQKYRVGSSTTGSSDIPVTLMIPGISISAVWKIEVKKGRDSLSTAQERYRDKTLRSGGLHSVIHVEDLSFFWDEYYKYMKLGTN
jgi:hypothetical protein